MTDGEQDETHRKTMPPLARCRCSRREEKEERLYWRKGYLWPVEWFQPRTFLCLGSDLQMSRSGPIG